jgi:ATP/ADP translocase
LLVALAVVLLLAAPVLAATLVRKRSWVLGAVAVPVVEVLLLAFPGMG